MVTIYFYLIITYLLGIGKLVEKSEREGFESSDIIVLLLCPIVIPILIGYKL